MIIDDPVCAAMALLAQPPEAYAAFEESLCDIVVPPDPYPAHISQAIIKLDHLHQQVYPLAIRAKAAYDNVSEILEEVMMSSGRGSNPTAMKADAARQAQTYDYQGMTVNLFELERAAKLRFTFYDGLMQAINQKHSRLITLLGTHNLEAKLTQT